MGQANLVLTYVVLLFFWIIVPFGYVAEISKEAEIYLKTKKSPKKFLSWSNLLFPFMGAMIAFNWKNGVGSVWIGILAFVLVMIIGIKFMLYTHFPEENPAS